MGENSWTMKVWNEFERKIEELKAKNLKFSIGNSVGLVIILTYKKVIAGLLLLLIISDLSAFTSLYLTIFFLKWLVDPHSEHWQGYFYAVILTFLLVFTSLTKNGYLFRTGELGVTIRKGLSGVIFKKVLRLNEKSRFKASSGKLVSIVSGELQALERGLVLVPCIITTPIVFILLMLLIGIYFKEAVVFGTMVTLFIFIIQFWAARRIKTYKRREGIESEKRLKIISDIINGIRTIKVYAWEIPFSKLVQKFR